MKLPKSLSFGCRVLRQSEERGCGRNSRKLASGQEQREVNKVCAHEQIFAVAFNPQQHSIFVSDYMVWYSSC